MKHLARRYTTATGTSPPPCALAGSTPKWLSSEPPVQANATPWGWAEATPSAVVSGCCPTKIRVPSVQGWQPRCSVLLAPHFAPSGGVRFSSNVALPYPGKCAPKMSILYTFAESWLPSISLLSLSGPNDPSESPKAFPLFKSHVF